MKIRMPRVTLVLMMMFLDFGDVFQEDCMFSVDVYNLLIKSRLILRDS